jgi:putative DNA primase/helicase
LRRWLVWNEGRWVADDICDIQRRAKDTARLIYEEAAAAKDSDERKKLAKWAARSESEGRIRAMISLARSEPGIVVRPSQLDADPWLLNCANGTVDLRTGELRPHRPGDLCTKQVSVEYDPGASCPTWNEFLAEIMNYNLRLVSFLQLAVGYSLTGDTSEQILFLLYGTGANGKTTFLENIKAVLGGYATQADFTTFLARKYDSVRNDVARLAGARFVSAIEADTDRRLSEVLIKSITGGDTIAARFLYAEFFEFHPQFKLFLAANHKPIIRGTDIAVWRRIRLIPFAVTIPPERQDRKLPEKLRAELRGVLAWAVRGCLAWQEHGLGAPEEVEAATACYREEMDVLGGFLSECCAQGQERRTKASELYQAYIQWCVANGEHPVKQRTFGMKLTERGFQRFRGAQGARMWKGIGLVTGVPESDLSRGNVPYQAGRSAFSDQKGHLGALETEPTLEGQA